MKNSSPYKIAANMFSIFESKIYRFIFLPVLILFIGLYTFFYGFYTIPLPTGVLGFFRMAEPTTFEIFYILFSATVSALITTITIYSIRTKLSAGTRGTVTSLFGVLTSIFGIVCPACLGINFLAFGNVFTAQVPFLVPYILWIQISGIVFLLIGLYFVAKNAYEKKCIMCAEDGKPIDIQKKSKVTRELDAKFIVLSFFVIALLVYQLTAIFGGLGSQKIGSVEKGIITIDSGEKIVIADMIETVTPKAGFTTRVQWGDIVAKMVQEEVLDPQKLEGILTKNYRQEMRPEWKAILAGEDITLSIGSDNAVFMMYVLWTLAKHNNNQILTSSPIASYFENYDIGVGRAGYGDVLLLSLTPEQQAIAKKVAENAYRPCCGQSTAAPDCSHGFSALGLIQLMASQGYSEKEIFDTFIQFNSFWFPETYIKNALYFKATEGLDWRDVSKELVAGAEYSTLQGSYKAKNYLKEKFGM
ncbi:hypothetical protein COY14_03090 [Candidatus Roizmanbacteria bacterium CG_4_10_14_0_2_um_filter_36_9]|uniref:Uncharacterized protein n=1 Tax=Candidatus Roizmanbacteria bacterium CG_4_10_14_0_2_um_filter_36_9 TaxID=1974823 RepID=A0A2M7U3Q0_9BACT|nr:MAG: hypothetical protein COY14_03090 [Candidatus Roizmanbacteria bacterium CG_4_10_14_0_2_um_filter_36_9]